MCDFGRRHGHQAFGFLVDAPEIRALVDETTRATAAIADPGRARRSSNRPSKLLAAEGWLPPEYASPDFHQRNGQRHRAIRALSPEDGSLMLFSLVIPAGAETPNHDHLAWGLDRRSRAAYRNHSSPPRRRPRRRKAMLEVSRTHVMDTGQFLPRSSRRWTTSTT
jgi:hypothetical protein